MQMEDAAGAAGALAEDDGGVASTTSPRSSAMPPSAVAADALAGGKASLSVSGSAGRRGAGRGTGAASSFLPAPNSFWYQPLI
jgi:hypothetical protein